MPRIQGTPPSDSMRKKAKKARVRLTVRKRGKIYYKTEKELQKDIGGPTDFGFDLERLLTVFDGNFELAINFYLLQKGVRPSFLIEFTNFYPSTYLAEKGVKFAFEELPTFLQAYESKKPKRYLISNPKMVSSVLFKKALHDDIALGKALGFLCPGGLFNKVSQLSYNAKYKGKEYNITTEICDKELSKAELKKIRDTWERANSKDVKFFVEYKLSLTQDLIPLLKRDDVSEVFENRREIIESLDLMDQSHFIIKKLGTNSLPQFKRWWAKNRNVVVALVVYHLNDPCEPAYPISNEQSEEMSKRLDSMIEDLQRVFS